MDKKEVLGLRLRKLRKERRLTQTQLGKMVGYSTDSISKIEKGQTKLSLEKAKALADALGADYSVLMIDDPITIKSDDRETAKSIIDRLSDEGFESAYKYILFLERQENK